MLVQFNSKRLLGFQDRLIMPGINDLPSELVADMQDDPIIAAKFDNEELEIIGAEEVGAKKLKTKKGTEPSGIDLLLAATDKAAVKLAGKTVDVLILDEWLGREKRRVVAKAIKEQLAKIRDIKYREETKKQKLLKSKDDEGDEE